MNKVFINHVWVLDTAMHYLQSPTGGLSAHRPANKTTQAEYACHVL